MANKQIRASALTRLTRRKPLSLSLSIVLSVAEYSIFHRSALRLQCQKLTRSVQVGKFKPLQSTFIPVFLNQLGKRRLFRSCHRRRRPPYGTLDPSDRRVTLPLACCWAASRRTVRTQKINKFMAHVTRLQMRTSPLFIWSLKGNERATNQSGEGGIVVSRSTK